jgi:ABC-type nitrate/sulfonate/bicarbonate transport system substrate-binding protein
MMALMLMAVSLTSAAPASAHDQFHIVGTITRHQAMMIVVKPTGPIASSIQLDAHTVVVRDNKQVDPSELKVGRTVVVDALGDTPEDMVAVFIRIVPPIKKGK